MTPTNAKSLESWIWDAACSIRGAKDAPKYKDYILPLIFTKRLCDVFDDELNRIAAEVGSRRSAFALAKADHKLVRFYLPLVPDDPEQPVWSVIRKLADRIGEGVTTQMRAIARENPLLQGIILERAVGRSSGCVPRGVQQGTTTRNSHSIPRSCNAAGRHAGRALAAVAPFTLRVPPELLLNFKNLRRLQV